MRRLATEFAEDRKTDTRNTHQDTRGTRIRGWEWAGLCTGNLGQRRQERDDYCTIQQTIDDLLFHIISFLTAQFRLTRLRRANYPIQAESVP